MFEELASKDYDRFRSVAELGEDVRLAAAERERKKKHTSACCDCDAATKNTTALCFFIADGRRIGCRCGVFET